MKSYLQDLTEVPAFEEDPSFYSDWGDPARLHDGGLRGR